MISRRNVFVTTAFSTIALAAALWAWSGGVASAQCPECPPPPPSPIVTCGAPVAPVECDGECEGSVPPVSCPPTLYTPDQRAKVFTFGPNNSIQVKFAEVTCDFSLTVELVPTPQAAFHERVAPSMCTPPSPLSDDGTGAPEITCNETVFVDVAGVPTAFCAVYRVNTTAPTSCYTGPVFDERVEYLVGWQQPVRGNKHDFFLLRDPSPGDPGDDGSACFTQNITFGGLDKKYVVGTIKDPGLGGRACCDSEYVVARQPVRPVSNTKKK